MAAKYLVLAVFGPLAYIFLYINVRPILYGTKIPLKRCITIACEFGLCDKKTKWRKIWLPQKCFFSTFGPQAPTFQ